MNLFTLLPDLYFVLGDSGDRSLNSQNFMAVSHRLIHGKPMVVYFSTNGFLKRRIGRIEKIIRWMFLSGMLLAAR